VIYNVNSTASKEIAQYYAHKRGIPIEQLLGIDVPQVETLPRERYDEAVTPAVRAFLGRHEWGGRIRCLVTCYDVPLRIASRAATGEEHRQADDLEERWQTVILRLRDLVARIRDADGDDAGMSPPAGRDDEKPRFDRETLPKLFQEYQEELQKLAARHNTLTGDALITARRRTFDFVVQAEGAEGLVNRAPTADDVSSNVAVRIRQMRDRVVGNLKKAAELLAGRTQAGLDEAWPIISDTRGLFGEASVLHKRITSLRGEETSASFDSELALVFWNNYDLSGWQYNNLCYKYHDGVDALEPGVSARRTIMVARLDAPTPEVVRRMIDASIEVEQGGLKGTFYIDARGLERSSGLFKYDDDLMRLAQIVRERTTMSLRLDVRSDVFQPGDCPDAALYCGWYSLSNYVDAFDFVPGAVAIHMASFELVSLRDDRKRYWCKELLSDVRGH